MGNFGFHEMQQIQKELQERYESLWGELSFEKGSRMLLWMMAEAGEAAQVIKKKGDKSIMEDEDVRRHFIEEMCDVMMYFNTVMLCYSISEEELEKVYWEKHHINMKRWETSHS